MPTRRSKGRAAATTFEWPQIFGEKEKVVRACADNHGIKFSARISLPHGRKFAFWVGDGQLMCRRIVPGAATYSVAATPARC